uniref:Chromosome (Plasmid) partitioning protein ParA n=1 Tax=Vibrio genomosp. F6 TaxID=723172 RepID=A0A0H3ZRU7_9VIBR|nr:Chromosome (plasmid) partitioning protein ParA [Vibrio genomosp. F6]
MRYILFHLPKWRLKWIPYKPPLRLLANHRKELRNFTRAKASAYLGIDAKTLDRYVTAAEIEPRHHEDSQWSIDISEMYRVRDLLPEILRKDPK